MVRGDARGRYPIVTIRTAAAQPWLASLGVTEVLIVGFFAHMCVSTSALLQLADMGASIENRDVLAGLVVEAE